jgi:BirA family biotin operon repressor/biotin-[acetyl-CoA-carboxylase] ligase
MTLDFRIRQLAVTQSSNDDAKRAAEAGEPAGLVIWALKQTGGKGRHGRTWESPEGNLYMSALLRPACDARIAALYSFAAALAVYNLVSESLSPHRGERVAIAHTNERWSGEGGVSGYRPIVPPHPNPLPLERGEGNKNVALKWPNDVLVDGKKIAGILLESATANTGSIEWLVIGIGLNVAYHPEGGLYPATSLAAQGATTLAVPTILDRLLGHLGHWSEMLEKQGFSPLRAAWLEKAHKGRMTVRLPSGALDGDFADLDSEGRLRLRLADGTEQAIATGDVFFV